MRRVAILLLCGTAALLAGCADNAGSGLERLLPDALSSGQPSADNQGTLYLGIVDGLIKQNRQSAALAFLDSYRQSGEALAPRYWLLRGKALLALHHDDDAAGAFRNLEDTPLAAHGWDGLGRIAAAAADWPAAERNFRKAVEADPANADFLNNLAFADLHLARAESATAWLQQAHELDPRSERIFTNLIIALTMKGDGPRADSLLAGIGDGSRRDAVRALVRSAVSSLNAKGSS